MESFQNVMGGGRNAAISDWVLERIWFSNRYGALWWKLTNDKKIMKRLILFSLIFKTLSQSFEKTRLLCEDAYIV